MGQGPERAPRVTGRSTWTSRPRSEPPGVQGGAWLLLRETSVPWPSSDETPSSHRSLTCYQADICCLWWIKTCRIQTTENLPTPDPALTLGKGHLPLAGGRKPAVPLDNTQGVAAAGGKAGSSLTPKTPPTTQDRVW